MIPIERIDLIDVVLEDEAVAGAIGVRVVNERIVWFRAYFDAEVAPVAARGNALEAT